MSRYAERIAELAHRVTGIDLKLKSLDDERATHSVEASQGAKSALQRIAALDAEADQLHRSKTTLTSAADQLDQMLREEEAAAAAGEREQRQAEARKIGAAVCTLNTEIDTAMTQLCQMFERRQHLISELRKQGGATSGRTLAMLSKEPGTAAARHAGLAKYVSIEPVPINNVRPLASSNGALPH